MLLAVILVARTQGPRSRSAEVLDLQNPIPATRESLEIGERLYRAQCQICHGAAGAGNGPAAAGLNPRPVDFRVHAAVGHTDGQLFDWITNGFEGTAMPAYKNTLSEDQRWHLVNFIKSLALSDR